MNTTHAEILASEYPSGWTCQECGREIHDRLPAYTHAGTYCERCTSPTPTLPEMRRDLITQEINQVWPDMLKNPSGQEDPSETWTSQDEIREAFTNTPASEILATWRDTFGQDAPDRPSGRA